MEYRTTLGWLSGPVFTDIGEGKLISIASVDSEAISNVPSLTSASSTTSSSSGSGVPLPPFPPPLQPLRVQRAQTQVRGPMGRQLSHQLAPPVILPDWQARTSCQREQPMPENPNVVTMNTIIDEILVPAFFARPGHSMFAPAEVKRRYVTETKAQHAKLALRIENWRQKIPSVENGLLPIKRNGWLDFVQKARQGKEQRLLREARDKKNIQDFINGEVEGVHKTRFICWYVEITASATKAWFKPKPTKGKRDLETQRTKSMEELNSIEDLVDA
ncbi:MAG: hypothetical protein Q9188_003506 [Gyalolechia gomerana]